jgi:hypothetical protein
LQIALQKYSAKRCPNQQGTTVVTEAHTSTQEFGNAKGAVAACNACNTEQAWQDKTLGLLLAPVTNSSYRKVANTSRVDLALEIA